MVRFPAINTGERTLCQDKSNFPSSFWESVAKKDQRHVYDAVPRHRSYSRSSNSQSPTGRDALSQSPTGRGALSQSPQGRAPDRQNGGHRTYRPPSPEQEGKFDNPELELAYKTFRENGTYVTPREAMLDPIPARDVTDNSNHGHHRDTNRDHYTSRQPHSTSKPFYNNGYNVDQDSRQSRDYQTDYGKDTDYQPDEIFRDRQAYRNNNSEIWRNSESTSEMELTRALVGDDPYSIEAKGISMEFSRELHDQHPDFAFTAVKHKEKGSTNDALSDYWQKRSRLPRYSDRYVTESLENYKYTESPRQVAPRKKHIALGIIPANEFEEPNPHERMLPKCSRDDAMRMSTIPVMYTGRKKHNYNYKRDTDVIPPDPKDAYPFYQSQPQRHPREPREPIVIENSSVTRKKFIPGHNETLKVKDWDGGTDLPREELNRQRVALRLQHPSNQTGIYLG